MITEIWKDVQGFEGRYQVSNLGRVRNLKGKILKPNSHRLGYLSVKLSFNNQIKTFFVHRLVAQSFLAISESVKNEVDHLNGIKSDNRLENLEWVSRTENMQRASANGLLKQPDNTGANNGMSKLTVGDVRKIKGLKGTDTQENIAKMFGVTRRAVGLIFSGKRWGYV